MNKPATVTQLIRKWARDLFGWADEDDSAPDDDSSGRIFCLSNSFMPGLVYIGATARPVDIAMKEINKGISEHFLGEAEDYQLDRFVLEWFEEVDDLWAMDDEMRRKLDYYADAEETSYFRCSPKEARSTLMAAIKQAGGDISR